MQCLCVCVCVCVCVRADEELQVLKGNMDRAEEQYRRKDSLCLSRLEKNR